MIYYFERGKKQKNKTGCLFFLRDKSRRLKALNTLSTRNVRSARKLKKRINNVKGQFRNLKTKLTLMVMVMV